MKSSLQPRMFTNRHLSALIIPLVIERILDVSLGFADTIMVSSVGEASVASVSLVDSVNFLFIFLFSALATGGAVVVSQYIGQKNSENASLAAKQLIYFSTCIALLFMSAFLLLNKKILSLIFGNLDPLIMEQAQTYFTLTSLSYPFLGLFNSGAALFRASGNSKTPMKIAVVMTISNIVGNAILIYIFNLGVFGAGVATLASRILAATLMLLFFLRQRGILVIDNLHKIFFNWKMIKRIMRVAVPNGIENGIFHIGKILVLSLTASFGTVAIAVNAVGNVIASMINIPGGAIGTAILTVIGQTMGAQEKEQATYYAYKLMKITYLTVAVVGILLFCFTTTLVGAFNLSDEATVLAIDLIRIFIVVNTILWPLSFSLPQVLRASGDVTFTMVVSISTMWVFRVGFSYILGLYVGLGLHGIWIAMYIDWLCRSILFTIRFLGKKWQTKQII